MTLSNCTPVTARRRSFLPSFALTGALACAACTSTAVGTGAPAEDPNDSAPKPSLSFGETDESPSKDASEMMGRPASNPDPTTLSGMYERTDYASENRPSDYLVITNDVRVRVEIRHQRIAAAIECTVDVGGRVSETKTLTAYASSPIEVQPWGIRVAKAVSAKDTWFDYDVSCGLDLPDGDWPYCVDSKIPDGYSSCVYMQSGRLYSKSIDGSHGEIGKKIRN